MEDQLLEWAKQAMKLAETQMPVLVEQYIRWWTIAHIIGIVFASLLISAAYLCAKKACRLSDDDDYIGIQIALSIASLIIGVAGLVMLPINIYYLIKIKISPAIYILDSFL